MFGGESVAQTHRPGVCATFGGRRAGFSRVGLSRKLTGQCRSERFPDYLREVIGALDLVAREHPPQVVELDPIPLEAEAARRVFGGQAAGHQTYQRLGRDPEFSIRRVEALG